MKYQHLMIFHVRYLQKIKSHTFKTHCYFSVHFNDILENRKLRSLLNLKNQNGTHHAY